MERFNYFRRKYDERTHSRVSVKVWESTNSVLVILPPSTRKVSLRAVDGSGTGSATGTDGTGVTCGTTCGVTCTLACTTGRGAGRSIDNGRRGRFGDSGAFIPREPLIRLGSDLRGDRDPDD